MVSFVSSTLGVFLSVLCDNLLLTVVGKSIDPFLLIILIYIYTLRMCSMDYLDFAAAGWCTHANLHNCSPLFMVITIMKYISKFARLRSRTV